MLANPRICFFFVLSLHALLLAWSFGKGPTPQAPLPPPRLITQTVTLAPPPVEKMVVSAQEVSAPAQETAAAKLPSAEPLLRQKPPDTETIAPPKKQEKAATEVKKITAEKEKKSSEKPQKKPAEKPKSSSPIQPKQEERNSNSSPQRQALLAKAKKELESSSKSRKGELLPIPSLPAFSVSSDSAGEEKPGISFYREELARHLRLLLRLPEFGEVRLRITLSREGIPKNMEILSSQSQANRDYIEKKIPTLRFPAFGSEWGSEKEHTFLLSLGNIP